MTRGAPLRSTAATLSLVLIFVASPAGAAAPTATLSLARDGGVLWAEAMLSEGEGTTVKTKFFAPQRSDATKRQLWQVCRFAYRGAAVYRCGIDVAQGSVARKHSGTWIVKVLIDGTMAAKKKFVL